MSISMEDNNIKIWNVIKWECILNLNNINNSGWLYSADFIFNNNQNYIATSNRKNDGDSEPIKIFDFNGNKIKEINNSNEATIFIRFYYDDILSKNYIISGNVGYIKAYDYDNNELYKKYSDNNNLAHASIIIKKNKENIELIESCSDGNIRIWDFHSGILLNKIKVSSGGLRDICLWNDNYIFVGCIDNSIKLIELRNNKIIKTLTEHNNWILTITKIIHPKYGECLISQNWEHSSIKIWVSKKIFIV